MTMTKGLVQEMEQECQTTRRVLERVPDDKLGWRPHEKSMTLGQLALHVATIPGAIAEIAMQSPFQIPDFGQPGPSATSAAELVPALDESIAKAKAIVTGLDDAALADAWKAVDGERQVMTVPRAALLRSIMLNHWYHHRGQLSVYLRLLNVPLPSIYGPSADENPFAV